MADAVIISRAQVLAYRAAAHDLEQPATGPDGPAVLSTGIQDNPPGRTAGLALRLRGGDPGDPGDSADGSAGGKAVLLHSVRAALHLHRATDAGRYAAALRFDDGADLAVASFGPFAQELAEAGVRFGAALDGVAAAMREVMADGEPRTKGELSGALTPRVDPRVAPWCNGCGVHHVHDALFRYATLQAGLRLVVDPPSVTRFLPLGGIAGSGGAAGSAGSKPPGAEASRRELTRRFLRLCGPTTQPALAAWLGITPAAAGRMLRLLDADLAAVEVDGRRAWMHAEHLEALAEAPPPARVRLLPPYDPVTELADRELLVPDRDRRRAVWRAATNPGVLLVAGDLVGVWRQRTARGRMTVTVQPFRRLSKAEQRAAAEDAQALAGHAGLAGAELQIES